MSEIGVMLREAREAAGISLSAMAARTHFTKGHLSNVEKGRRKATPEVVLAYEQVLGDSVDRRGLLTGVAAGVVAPIAVSELIRQGFTAALGSRRSDDEWQQQVDEYGRDYMSVGAAELQNRMAGDLVVLQQHLETPALWGVAARLLTVHGKTVPSDDGARSAARWYRLAAVSADRSGDTAVRVWARGRAALALAYEAAGLNTATELADQALALSDTPSIGRLNAFLAKAHVAGVRGDKKTAIAELEQAKRVFDRAGSYEQISDFAMPEWRMATISSMLLSRMGDPGAVAEQDRADRTRPATLPRFATHIELHRGLMQAKAGDRAGGVAYAKAALAKLPPERHSLSLRLLMDEIERVPAGAAAKG
jgi:transcriptional regulator with XRE-family HTH domain